MASRRSASTQILQAERSRPAQGGPSFTLSNRLTRLVWRVCWMGLCSWTPSFAWKWRRVVLVCFGATMHRRCDVRGSASVWLPKNLVMGEGALIAERVICYNQAEITIADGALVSQGAHLCAGTHDVDDLNFQLIARPIRIEKAAWVAADAFVGPGSLIEEGAVLGARGVCFGRLTAWGVYAGNPARFIRERAKR